MRASGRGPGHDIAEGAESPLRFTGQFLRQFHADADACDVEERRLVDLAKIDSAHFAIEDDLGRLNRIGGDVDERARSLAVPSGRMPNGFCGESKAGAA